MSISIDDIIADGGPRTSRQRNVNMFGSVTSNRQSIGNVGIPQEVLLSGGPKTTRAGTLVDFNADILAQITEAENNQMISSESESDEMPIELNIKSMMFRGKDRELRQISFDVNEPIFFRSDVEKKTKAVMNCPSCLYRFQSEKEQTFCQFCGRGTCKNCIYKTRLFPNSLKDENGKLTVRGKICCLCDRQFIVKTMVVSQQKMIDAQNKSIQSFAKTLKEHRGEMKIEAKEHEEKCNNMKEEIDKVKLEIVEIQGFSSKQEDLLESRRKILNQFDNKSQSQEQQIYRLKQEIQEIKSETETLKKTITDIQNEIIREQTKVTNDPKFQASLLQNQQKSELRSGTIVAKQAPVIQTPESSEQSESDDQDEEIVQQTNQNMGRRATISMNVGYQDNRSSTLYEKGPSATVDQLNKNDKGTSSCTDKCSIF